MQSNSPIPIKGMAFDTLSIVVNFCLHSDMQYSTSFFILFLHLVCVSVVLGVRWRELPRCSKMDLTNVMWLQPLGVSQSVVSFIWTDSKPPGDIRRQRPVTMYHSSSGSLYIRQLALRHRQEHEETAKTLQMDFQQATGLRINTQTV